MAATCQALHGRAAALQTIPPTHPPAPNPSLPLRCRPDLPAPPPPPLNPATRQPLTAEDLAPIFPMGLIQQEASIERYIEIPEVLGRCWGAGALVAEGAGQAGHRWNPGSGGRCAPAARPVHLLRRCRARRPAAPQEIREVYKLWR